MGRKLTITLTVAAVVVLVLAILAEPALAKGTPEQTGDNFGDLIRGIFRPIVVTIGGVIGIAAIAKRDYLLAIALVGVTIIILGFLMDPSPYETWGPEVLHTAFGVGGGTIGGLR
jgi:hypothetical protein